MARRFYLFIILTTIIHSVSLAGDDTAWWGYWNSSRGLTEAVEFNTGSNECSIRVASTTNPLLAGCKIHGIRFFISDKTAVDEATVWVTGRELTNKTKSIVVSPESLKDWRHDGQATEVMFDEPIVLLDKGNRYASAYVGFTVHIQGGRCSMMTSGRSDAPANSNFIGTTAIEKTYGDLAIQLLLSSDNFAEEAVNISDNADLKIIADKSSEIPWHITQEGTSAITSVGYEVRMGTDIVGQGTYDLPQPLNEMGASTTLPVQIKAPVEAAIYDCEVKVTHVNNHPNANTSAIAHASVYNLSRRGTRRVVMEEVTATWCNNCTRGIVGIKKLHEQFGEAFIGIAMHGTDDPMLVREYRSSRIGRKMPSLPSCYIDRKVSCDPYIGLHPLTDMHFYADEVVAAELEEMTEADINITATWANTEKTAISVDATTTFYLNHEQAPYSIALILLEDDMHGEGAAWTQINGYSYTQEKGEGLDDDMQEFVNAPYRITDMHFNHVAVQVAGIDDGIAQSISKPLVSDAAQHFSYDWSIADNPIIQDRSKLTVVALLLNTEDGTVINAAQTAITVADDIDVPQTKTQGKPLDIYDLSGRRLRRDAKGLVIVRQTDGSIVKSFISQ